MLKLSITLIAIVLLFTSCSYQNGNTSITHNLEKKENIYSIKQAKNIDMKNLVKELEHYSIIFVGDHHNNAKTHKFFENLLKELDNNGYNLYLANEWFTPKHDKLLLKFTNKEISSKELKEKREWEKFTKYKWEYVEPLYKIVRDNGGKLFGINISKEDRKKISLQEFDKMSEEEKTFFNSLDLNVSAHKQLVMPFLKHCNKIPQKSAEPCEQRMYRIQVTWDTYMAQNVSKIAKELIKSKKDKLLVFAGAMHMEHNLGIPLRFSRLNNLHFYNFK